MGHALNKILKDIVVKSLWMDGYESPYVPGWDCHGLPIEHAVEKDLGPKRREMTRAEFLARCRAYAQKWIDTQRTGFQRLGVLGAWDQPYVTMAPSFEAGVVRLLAQALRERRRHPQAEGGALELRRPHGPGRGRGGVRRQDQLRRHRGLPGEGCRGRPAPGTAHPPLPAHLDHHALDPAEQPGHRHAPGHGIRRRPKAGDRHYVVVVPLLEDFQKKLGVELHIKEIRKGIEFQTLEGPACLDRPREPGAAGRLRHRRRGHGPGAHRPGPRRGRLQPGPPPGPAAAGGSRWPVPAGRQRP